jgi:hypothetical protein
MAERLPYAQIETGFGVKPWPGYLTIGDKSPLAILAKPGTRIIYKFPIDKAIQLQLLCGVSSDSYQADTDGSFMFEAHQLEPDGRILAESRVTLQPGIRKEDREWRPMVVALKQARNGVLEFRYSQTGKESAGVGAFAESVFQPIP